MKSTTGAYEEFPDYYYEPGNQFGSYLLGHTAPMSWDTKRELEALDGGFTIVHAAHARKRKSIPGTPHAVLMEYVRKKIKRDDAVYVLSALATARGITLVDLTTKDPYSQLDEFVVSHLSPEEQLAVLARLRAAVAEGERRARQRLLDRAKARGRKRRHPKPRPKSHAKGSPQRANAGKSTRNGPNHCSICSRAVSPEDRKRCAAKPQVFHGHVYCSEHIQRLGRTLKRPSN